MTNLCSPLLLVTKLFGDELMDRIFSEEQTVQCWLSAESALALAQAKAGVLTQADAEAITGAAVLSRIDFDTLWREARNVGYPILSLVRMISAALPEGPNGRVHYGATTQDIMDTALALQMRDGLVRLEELLKTLGAALVKLIEEHRHTVLAARTHNQQAVPTTFGVKMATFLAELQRHCQRIKQARPRICVVSLFGAGGTSAALGDSAPQIRRTMAELLGLMVTDVPWHVTRDIVAEFGLICSGIAATCARFAREVIGLVLST